MVEAPRNVWTRRLAGLVLAALASCGGGGNGSNPTPPPTAPATGVMISVSVSPRFAGLTVGQQLSVKLTTNDSAGVTLQADPAAGTLDTPTVANGSTVHFTAGTTPGTYAIKVTSVTDPSQTASLPVGITDLVGVYTYHDDLSRDGVNAQEYTLTPGNVTAANFGKLFSCTTDGAVYTQPLWVANLTVGGAKRNVVFVGTAHDGLFAFDADATPCQTLWSVSLIDGQHGGTAGETPVASTQVGKAQGDMTPEIGVTGTPVIDSARALLYVVSKSWVSSTSTYYQRLHAISLATGSEAPGSPVVVAPTYPGRGDGGTTVSFNPRTQNQRAALTLANGIVYVAWGSHEDGPPFYGWMVGYTYNGSRFAQASVLNAAPNSYGAGIWMSGAGPAVDAGGNLYVATGNGGFTANMSGNDYGDSFLQLSGALAVQQYFTPSNQQFDAEQNNDFGAGGATVLADLPAGSPITHVAITGGKDGVMIVLNRDALGGYGDNHAWQRISVGTEGPLGGDTPGVIWGSPAYWNGSLYLAGAAGPLQTYHVNAATAQFSVVGQSTTPSSGFGFPGSSPSISASGLINGIVWAVDSSHYCTASSPACGPAVLHAYDASNLARELWNSAAVASDAAGNAVKFVVPTVANGKVYLGTRGNNTGGVTGSSSTPGEVDVYGPKPN